MVSNVKDVPAPPSPSPLDNIGRYDSSGCLGPTDLFWYDHRDWLKEQGYLLRARYQAGWVPSWTDGTLGAYGSEDGQYYIYPGVMDATVSSDGSFVMMKKVKSPSAELDIAVWFSAEPRRSDPANHCVPIYSVLSDPNEPDWAIIVMPLLRRFDKPRFDTIGEAVGFFTQIFEGLQFMHKNNVAHRDCTSMNIMMDGSSLYPIPFHPIKQHLKRDFSGKAPHLTRTQRPVKYYLTDFGLSRQYKLEERPPLEPIIWAGDKSAPEYQVCDACDPFPTDIYHLGNLIRREFLGSEFVSQKRGFEFMVPLVADMVQTDPSLRPEMDEVVRRFGDIVQGLNNWKLRSRVSKASDFFGFITVFPIGFGDFNSLSREFLQFLSYPSFSTNTVACIGFNNLLKRWDYQTKLPRSRIKSVTAKRPFVLHMDVTLTTTFTG
ncbi:kinase-like domain-containing protein [Mycena sp. CBHHK59/15]|nr:kinase-like domain-containing protein [Mycena sp. CBHHK59/15]